MSTYDQYLTSAQNSARKQQEAYEKQRKQQLQSTLDSLTAAAKAEQAALQQAHDKQLAASDRSYEALFDRNAIREAVSRKTVAERMANLGLTDSGLNRTQQTAIAVTRSKADAGAENQRQQARNELAAELLKALAQSNSTLASRKADAIGDAEADMQANLSDLMAIATDQANSRYSTAVKASTSSKTAAKSYADDPDFIKTYIELLKDANIFERSAEYPAYAAIMESMRQRLLGQ